MSKEQLLETIKLLSAFESWAFSCDKPVPDYLLERLDKAMGELSKELLK